MSPSGPNQPTSRGSSSGLAFAAQPQRPHSRPLTEPAKAHQNSHLRMHTPAAVCGAGVAPRGGVIPATGKIRERNTLGERRASVAASVATPGRPAATGRRVLRVAEWWGRVPFCMTVWTTTVIRKRGKSKKRTLKELDKCALTSLYQPLATLFRFWIHAALKIDHRLLSNSYQSTLRAIQIHNQRYEYCKRK